MQDVCQVHPYGLHSAIMTNAPVPCTCPDRAEIVYTFVADTDPHPMPPPDDRAELRGGGPEFSRRERRLRDAVIPLLRVWDDSADSLGPEWAGLSRRIEEVRRQL
jgi:hypothetical protein